MIFYTDDFLFISKKFSSNEMSVFAYEKYLKNISSKYGWFYNDNYFLPIIFKNKKFYFFNINVAQFTTGINYKSNFENNIEDEKYFLNEIIVLLKKKKVDFVMQPSTNALFNIFPDNSLNCYFGTYKIDLRSDLDSIFSNFHSKHRNVIRKAEKDGVIIKSGISYKDDAYSLLKQTYDRQNKICISKSKFLSEIYSLSDNCKIYVSYYNDIPQSSAVLLYNSYSSYYLHGGLSNNPKTGANNLLHWKAIQDMHNEGVKYYDFMGARINVDKNTKLYGIQNFKSRFCPDLVQGFLWKFVFNKFKYWLYYLLLSMKMRLFGQKYEGDVIDQERKKGNFDF